MSDDTKETGEANYNNNFPAVERAGERGGRREEEEKVSERRVRGNAVQLGPTQGRCLAKSNTLSLHNMKRYSDLDEFPT